MYFWLVAKTGSTPIAATLSLLVYSVLMFSIFVFWAAHIETFRYLKL
jgi:hypothetical protein